LEIKGATFSIGDQYQFVPKDQQINDPYFRKLDTYVRQNNDLLGAASILYTESKDDGQAVQFRTVYFSQGKSFHSTASIDKESQSVNEGTLSEIIEVPLDKTSEGSECNNRQTKLDTNDLSANGYYTAAAAYVEQKYAD